MITTSSKEAELLIALKDVEDPELQVSIVDLGLVVRLAEKQEEIDIQLTFTSMGCPATEMIIDDVRSRLLREPGVQSVNIEIVWDPIWSKALLTEDGKAALREWGISV